MKKERAEKLVAENSGDYLGFPKGEVEEMESGGYRAVFYGYAFELGAIEKITKEAPNAYIWFGLARVDGKKVIRVGVE